MLSSHIPESSGAVNLRAPESGAVASPVVATGSTENTPLMPPGLGSNQAPILGRCLLTFSGNQLFVLLWVLYLVHLYTINEFQQWMETVRVMFLADVLCAFCGSLSLLFMILFVGFCLPSCCGFSYGPSSSAERSIPTDEAVGPGTDPGIIQHQPAGEGVAAIGADLEAGTGGTMDGPLPAPNAESEGWGERNGSCCGVLCLLWLLFCFGSVAWIMTLLMSAYHHLEVVCTFGHSCEDPKTKIPNLHFHEYGLFNCWQWLALGLWKSIGAIFWRPWWFIAYALPMWTFTGHGPLPLQWAEWREIIVGTVLWLCVTFTAIVMCSRFLAEIENTGRRFLFFVGLTFSSIVTYHAVILTCEPFAGLWVFIAEPPIKLGTVLVKHSKLEMPVEEWLAFCVLLWALARAVWIAASWKLEQWSARKKMEEGLRFALAHPFRCELEQGFGASEAHPQSSLSSSNLVRSLSRRFSGVGLLGNEHLKGMKAKQENLIAARRHMLREQAAGSAVLPTHLSFRIRRDYILEDTCKVLFERPVSELLAPHMSVTFEGEAGIDAGGLTRDWFDGVAKALAQDADDPKGTSYLAAATDQTLIPRCVENILVDTPSEERFRGLLSIGKFLALAVLRERPLPLSFSIVVCKYFLRVPVGMHDVRSLDPAFFRGRVEQVLKDGGLGEMEAALGEPLTFISAPTELHPEPEELVPGGASKIVTEENKREYVQLLCEAYLCGGIRREIQCLLQGFWDILPLDLLNYCQVGPRELSVMISGISELDPEAWRAHCDQGDEQGGAASSGALPVRHAEVYEWFWRLVTELESDQRCLLLHFATGSSRLPPGGFSDLTPHFSVDISEMDSPDHLPIAHTCVNKIVLPRYASYEQLREKTSRAIMAEGFGMV